MKFIGTILACLLGGAMASGQTIYFDDADRGPAELLQIGGATIYGAPNSSPPGLPATVLGSGLGNAAIGPWDSIDYIAHFEAGDTYPDLIEVEGLRLVFDQDISTITLVPHFPIVLETGAAVDDEFAWFGATLEWTAALGIALPNFYPSNSGPRTLVLNRVFPDAPIDVLNIWMDREGANAYPQEAQTLADFRLAHLSEDQTIQLGFTILSVGVTVIPEPGLVALLGIGLFGVFCSNVALRRRA